MFIGVLKSHTRLTLVRYHRHPSTSRWSSTSGFPSTAGAYEVASRRALPQSYMWEVRACTFIARFGNHSFMVLLKIFWTFLYGEVQI